MEEIRLLFGRPVIRGKEEFIATMRELQESRGCVLQALDAERVANERHAIFAAEKAIQAFAERRNVAKDLGVEILRYASGQRQIDRALAMGLSEETSRIALIIITDGDVPDLSGLIEEDGRGSDFNVDKVKESFDISEEEIATVGENRIPDLVLERVALVDAYR